MASRCDFAREEVVEESCASLTQPITLWLGALEPDNARTIAISLLLRLPHQHNEAVRPFASRV